MKRLFRGFPLLLLLIAALTASCAASKETSKAQTKTSAEMSEAGRSAEAAAGVLDQAQHNLLQTQTDASTTKRLFSEPIPSERASVTIPTQNLLNLPEGAKYGTQEGRASVEAERHGDHIVLTGKCDSIARLCVSFEQNVFRQRQVIDSLSRLLAASQSALAQYDARAAAGSDTIQTVEQTKRRPSRWFWWLSLGFLAGGTAASCLTRTNPLKVIVQFIKKLV